MMLNGTKNEFGTNYFDLFLGVPQGGVLSPLLFNVYLDEALKSQETLNLLVQKQMLRAFADDIVCIVKNREELQGVIKSFEELMNKFNIHINKKKTQYVAKVKRGDTSTAEVEGISRVTDYKYLGLTVTHGKKKILRTARDTVEKQVRQLGSAVNGCV